MPNGDFNTNKYQHKVFVFLVREWPLARIEASDEILIILFWDNEEVKLC